MEVSDRRADDVTLYLGMPSVCIRALRLLTFTYISIEG